MKLEYILDLENKSKDEILEIFKEKALGKELREEILKNYSEDFKEVLKHSDKFLKEEIVFDKKWDMERCKREFKFKDGIDWCKIPFGDPEWTYMLNRHKHMVLYAESYYITGEDKYFYKLKSELLNWIENVRFNEKDKAIAWRTIEAGIRLRNWVKIFELIVGHRDFDYNFLEKILIAVYEHIQFIFENSRNDRYLSNWVILENHGIFMAGAFFSEFKNSKKIRERSLKIIEKALDMQIYSDGLQWEQSFMYHNEMVNSILDMVLVGHNNGFNVTDKIREKLKSMTEATLNIAMPNMKQENYGDSDEEDLTDVLLLGAIAFKDSKFKIVNKLTLDALLVSKINGLNTFKDIELSDMNIKSVAFEDAGNYILRNKYGKDGTYTFFKNGPLGSGHGHYDLLHFTINHKGENILSDSGRYTYREDSKMRILLKEAKSHNTILVDNEEFTNAKGSWGTLKVATPVKRPHKFGRLGSLVEGSHLGYLDKGVFVNRKLIYIEDGIWLVSDEFFSKGHHNYKSYYNFESDDFKVSKNRVVYKNGKFTLVPLSRQEISIEKSYVSKEYNSIYESKKVVLNFDGEENINLNTIMYLDDIVKSVEYVNIYDWKGKRLSRRFAKAVKIILEDKEYIIVTVMDEEDSGRKTYTVDNTQIYGRVTVIKRTDSREEIEVLSY